MGMMINRRRVLGGKSLPYDAEIEYLESTGTQYIDSLIKIKGTIRHKSKFYGGYLFGSYYGGRVSLGNGSYLLKNGNTNKMQFNIHSYFSPDITLSTGVHVDSFIGNKYTIDGSSYTVPSMTFTTDKNFLIFGSSSYAGSISAKFYYFQIYDGNIIVRDFIPVRKGTTGYMYDKVNGQLFGNAGTGEFILGPDK